MLGRPLLHHSVNDGWPILLGSGSSQNRLGIRSANCPPVPVVEHRAVVFVIEAAHGGIAIGPYSQYPAEAEVLFPPFLRLHTLYVGGPEFLTENAPRLTWFDWVRTPELYGFPPSLSTEAAATQSTVVVFCEQLSPQH